MGLDPTTGPIAFRAAPLGAVSAELAAAILYDYDPASIGRAMAEVSELAAAQARVSARQGVADRVFRRLLGDAVTGSEMREAAELARRAAEAASGRAEGRPLFAAHAALGWPVEAHLVLWHAVTLLHEWRSDGRIAVLTAESMSGLDWLVGYAATGRQSIRSIRVAHGWADAEWKTAVQRLRDRGRLRADGDPVALALTDPVFLTFTDEGREQYLRIDERTDAAAASAYASLGEQGGARLRELCAPWTATIAESNGSTGER
ncbi:MAG TPA: hypothetical protein VFN21_08700, partial [Acidimicrobiales bacterium]|nr:hypothetical protein [Acidimicrobiales bacterium]